MLLLLACPEHDEDLLPLHLRLVAPADLGALSAAREATCRCQPTAVPHRRCRKRSEGGRAIRDHGRSHDSDAAKEQLSSGPRLLAQARALPISNDPMGCAADDYGKGDDPGAPGNW